MISIYRWILKLRKKEHILRTNYHKSHPHFYLYIGLDAVLSFALVMGVTGFAASQTSNAVKLGHAGGAAMSVEELVKHVKTEPIDAFWLGYNSNYKYTLDHSKSGIVDIFYFPKDADQTNTKLFSYEIKSYENIEVWNAHTHTLRATSGTVSIQTAAGLTIKISPDSLRGEIVTFSDRPEIVGIAYPTPQSRENLIKNAESLSPIR
jgi:hypothetical protein